MDPRTPTLRLLAAWLIAGPAAIGAQTTVLSVAAGLGGWRSVPAYATEAPGTGLVDLSVERPASWGLGGVLGLGYAATAFRGHDVAICFPLPGGGCRRDSVFPRGVLGADASVRFQPRYSPFAVSVGGGLAWPLGQLPGSAGSDVPQLDAAATTFWQVGAELQLWRGARAPRLRLVRRTFRQPLFDAAGLTVVSVAVPAVRWRH